MKLSQRKAVKVAPATALYSRSPSAA